MGIEINDGTTGARIDVVRALRTTTVPRGDAFSAAGVSGTIAAAIGANSSVFAMRLDPSSGTRIAYIEQIHVAFTTLVAFTVPLTAGRRLALFRGTAGAPTGGTTIVPSPKNTGSAGSEFLAANGGIIQIATTGALTMTGVTFDADPIRNHMLSHVGSAGSHDEHLYELHATQNSPITLLPGQLIAIRNPIAMDAGGTWQLSVSVEWHEDVAYAT